MKQTNDKVTLELQHMVTGNMIAWKHVGHHVPARSYLDNRVKKLTNEHQNLVKKHSLPTTAEGMVDYHKVEDEELILKLAGINQQILKTQMDSLACIIDPVNPLPEGYKNKRELLEECIGSYQVIPMITHFFSEHSPSSILSPADGKPLILFRRQNGEVFDPFPEWTEHRKNGSLKETSSTG